MRRTVVIEQPNYLPWIGYFDLIRQSDVWIWYDDVQYTKRDWRNRNRIAADVDAEWLTIPVKTKGRFAQRICDVEIDMSQPWMRRHLESIDSRAFAAAGIELQYIVYDYPPYARGSRTFVPNLSIVDALAWLGARGTADYLAAHSRCEREVIAC